jgi:hypothetical protein
MQKRAATLTCYLKQTIAARRLRNALVHEYMNSPQIFLESHFAAEQACHIFFSVIDKAEEELDRLGVPRFLPFA